MTIAVGVVVVVAVLTINWVITHFQIQLLVK